jgi:hypothetical protein
VALEKAPQNGRLLARHRNSLTAVLLFTDCVNHIQRHLKAEESFQNDHAAAARLACQLRSGLAVSVANAISGPVLRFPLQLL